MPWCLTRLSLFTALKHVFYKKQHARLSKLKVTPAMAHPRWHTSNRLICGRKYAPLSQMATDMSSACMELAGYRLCLRVCYGAAQQKNGTKCATSASVPFLCLWSPDGKRAASREIELAQPLYRRRRFTFVEVECLVVSD